MTRTEIWLTEMMCHFKSIDDMRRYYEHLVSLPNCNTCKRKNCKHKPKYGEDVRFNCFAYTDEEPKDEPHTKLCRECDDYAGDGMYCASNHIVYDFSTSKGNCEPQTDCPWK